MFTIIGLMLTGMLLGFLLRKQKLSRNTQSHHRSYLVATLFIGYRCRRQSENYQWSAHYRVGSHCHHLGSSAGQCYSSMGFMVCTLQKK